MSHLWLHILFVLCKIFTCVNGSCHSLSDATGTVFNQKYENHQRECWFINSNSMLELRFILFHTENDCDTVNVSPKSTSSAPSNIYMALTGLMHPPPRIVLQGPVYLNFSTDGSKMRNGFYFTYKPYLGADGNILTEYINGGSGIRYSNVRRYNPTYGDNWLKSWVILAGNDQIVRIIFNSDFETESGCDFVKIYRGNNTSSSPIFSHSGSSVIQSNSQVTTAGTITITFTTDGSVTKQGFSFNYAVSDLTVNYESYNLFRTEFSGYARYDITNVQCSNRNDKCDNQVINPIIVSSSAFSFDSIADSVHCCNRFKCSVRFSNVVGEAEVDVNLQLEPPFTAPAFASTTTIALPVSEEVSNKYEVSESNQINTSSLSSMKLPALGFALGFCCCAAVATVLLLVLRAKWRKEFGDGGVTVGVTQNSSNAYYSASVGYEKPEEVYVE